MHLKTLILCTIALLCGTFTFGQNQQQYAAYVEEAWALYQSEDYQASAEKYSMAFDQLGGKAFPDDRYNAACSYALAGVPDSAFYHLFYLAEHPRVKYKDLDHITTDSDLESLYPDERWGALISIVATNKEEYEKDLDKTLVAILDTVYQTDQGYRRQIREVEEEYGRDSEEMQAHWKLISETDSINLIKVRAILDERGWLGPEVVGDQGNSTLFLVIQHADHETQLKYLPMMREAVQAGNARASSLALLEDRVALGQGKQQIYGSQIGRDRESGEYYVLPLAEPEKVNERRAEVGLGPIEDYVSNWGMSWDVEEHKRKMKELEAREKD